MEPWLALLSFGLLITSFITSLLFTWGPKKLLLISAFCSFFGFFGMILLTKGINSNNIILGIFSGGLITLLNVWGAFWSRFWAKRGKKTIDLYMNENPDALKWLRKDKKE
jgi:hypothetical protein